MSTIPLESITTEAAIPLRKGPYNISLSCPSGGYCPSYEYCPPSEAYCADGDIIWVKDGPSWDEFWPRNTTFIASFSQEEASDSGPHHAQVIAGYKTITCPGDPDCRQPIISISGVADTLTVQNNLTIQRLTFILLGFSIILLLDIVDAIIPEPTRVQKKKRVRLRASNFSPPHML